MSRTVSERERDRHGGGPDTLGICSPLDHTVVVSAQALGVKRSSLALGLLVAANRPHFVGLVAHHPEMAWGPAHGRVP